MCFFFQKKWFYDPGSSRFLGPLMFSGMPVLFLFFLSIYKFMVHYAQTYIYFKNTDVHNQLHIHLEWFTQGPKKAYVGTYQTSMMGFYERITNSYKQLVNYFPEKALSIFEYAPEPFPTLNAENAMRRKFCTHKKSRKILRDLGDIFLARLFSFHLCDVFKIIFCSRHFSA